MKLEVGKCYRTRDGRKVGPMQDNGFGNGILHAPETTAGWAWYDCGSKMKGFKRPDDLVEEWKEETTMDKITMDGKYAYRKDPFTQVRILCIDRPNVVHPIMTMDSLGNFNFHSPTGASAYYPQKDLVPLQVKLPDLWLIHCPDGNSAYFKDKDAPVKYLERYPDLLLKGAKIVHYIPAPDQTS